MSYTLISNNGNIVIVDEITDTTSTSLSLSGRGAIDWGDNYAQNFLNLVENFSGSVSPNNPRQGQQWWDSANQVMKVYSNSNTWDLVSDASATADRLSNARTIALTGAVSGSASFDGSTNIAIAATLNNTGVTAGNYTSANLTIGSDGRVLSASSGVTGNAVATAVNSFNTRIGNVTLTSGDVITALGYTPTNGGLTSISSANVTTALGYTPANDTLVVHKAGDTMSGTLNMNGNRITGLPAPSDGAEPARLTDLNAVSAAVGNKTLQVFQSVNLTQYSVTVSPNAPSGGSDGDVWYRY